MLIIEPTFEDLLRIEQMYILDLEEGNWLKSQPIAK